MSNSIVFLLIAVGLSVFGSLIVWIHGRPRRKGSSVDHFNRGLRALSTNGSRREPLSGVTLRRPDDAEVDAFVEEPVPSVEAPAIRTPRPSPRPSPRPVSRARPQPSEREGSSPGS